MILKFKSRKCRFILALAIVIILYYFISKKLESVRVYYLASDLTTTSFCRIPSLPLWPADWKFEESKVDCANNQRNWVYVEEGRLFFRDSIYAQHGGFSCKQARAWSVDYKDMLNNSHVLYEVTDFVCKANDDELHMGTLLGVVGVQGRVDEEWVDGTDKNSNLKENGLNLDIIMIGFDSVSRLMWERDLRKTLSKFRGMGGVVMERYNILGDGTPQALLPILTGQTEMELPEARKGFYNASTVDGHPWIWKTLKKRGYVTQWGEESPELGTFTYRMLGFKKQPVDHYMEPFQRRSNPHYCFDQQPTHHLFLNYLREFLSTYDENQRKFSFLFHSQYSHDSDNMLHVADNDLVELLSELEVSGVLDRSLLILMSDHGARFSKFRATEQGKYEERLPFMAIRVPQSTTFRQLFPHIQKNLQINSLKLTSPFDIHQTFLDVLHYRNHKQPSSPPTRPYKRGISLFAEIPPDRMCEDIGIEAHWCSCMRHTPFPTNHPLVNNLSAFTITHLNNLLSSLQPPCSLLTLANVTSAVQMVTNKNLLAFKGSWDSDGRKPDLSDQMDSTLKHMMITLTTLPNNAIYEVTLSVEPYGVKQISRINAYGNQPSCIRDKFPHLRAYCFCL